MDKDVEKPSSLLTSLKKKFTFKPSKVNIKDQEALNQSGKTIHLKHDVND